MMAPGPLDKPRQDYVAQERRRSAEHGGRSIFGWEPPEDAALTASARRSS